MMKQHIEMFSNGSLLYAHLIPFAHKIAASAALLTQKLLLISFVKINSIEYLRSHFNKIWLSSIFSLL